MKLFSVRIRPFWQTMLVLLGFSVCCAVLSTADAQSPVPTATSAATPQRNVIIMVGDGMGFNSHVAGSYWRHGELGKQPVDSFPVHLAMSTFSLTKGAVSLPPNVNGYDSAVFWTSLEGTDQGTSATETTDSAAAATTMYSGVKTLDGRMGMTAEAKPLPLISDVAVEKGWAAGAVSTVQISHATPGAFGSHTPSRNTFDVIFNEMLQAGKLTVLFGAGHPYYTAGKPNTAKELAAKAQKARDVYIGGEKTIQRFAITKDGVTQQPSSPFENVVFFDSRDEFVKLRHGDVSQPAVMTTAKKNSPVLVGIGRDLEAIAPVDGAPEDVPEAVGLLKQKFKTANFDELPTLSDMSVAALNSLKPASPNGFVLVIEGGAIDWAGHSRDIQRNVMEHTGFMKAIAAVCQWVEKNSSWEDTLLLVVADHETGNLWGPKTYTDTNDNGIYDKGDVFHGFRPIENRGKGKIPDAQFGTGKHSNALVPVWAIGSSAELLYSKVRGVDTEAASMWKDASNFEGRYIDNTDLFPVMLQHLKL